MNRKLSAAVAMVVVVAVVVVCFWVRAAVTVNQNIISSGVVSTSPGVGVFSDADCTSSLTSVNWGSVAAGSSATQTFYVKNTGTGSISLGLAASSWSPTSASTYITVTWNQQGTNLAAGQSAAATVTLSVSSSITGVTSFSNTLTISGTG